MLPTARRRDPQGAGAGGRRAAGAAGLVDRVTARLLETRWLMRMPIPLYRAGLGWILGERLVMIEHLGRVSHEPRFVVVEVVERERNAIRVASGFGEHAQWYRNLRANGVAYLSTGRARRVRAQVRLLDRADSETVLRRYAAAHPEAWQHLHGAMDYAAGGDAHIPVVEFAPPTGPPPTGRVAEVLPRATARLRFRQMTPADLDAMAGLLGDPDVMRFYPAPKTREQAAAWIAWNQRNYAEHGYGLWIIETHAGDFVGDCGLTWQEVNGVRKLEVGYHVTATWQGSGFATEAATACRDFAREHVGARELVAIIHPDNRASERVAEKIGMHRVEDHLAASGSRRIVLSMTL
ncbi:GNAT family N-acetyltransferase [Microbacterium sp. ZW CA_36]|uniref:GNAT family N-acetyltransferase n=1 Tax=Microbacterium sp. ZW CA_36 TaxID=3378078 RepID=UPI003852BB6F